MTECDFAYFDYAWAHPHIPHNQNHGKLDLPVAELFVGFLRLT